MNVYISVLPFINFLRKSGLEISIDESIVAQEIINLGYFTSSETKTRQALKSILVRRRSDFDIFDSCFDIYFLKSYHKEDNDSFSNSSRSNNHDADLIDEFDQLEVNNASKSLDIADSTIINPDIGSSGSGDFESYGQPEDEESSQLLSEVMQIYLRWLPDSLHQYGLLFIKPENESRWKEEVKTFIELVFGYGQYKHTQSIAERYNRFSQNFIRAYIQTVEEIKEQENISSQIKYLKQLEYLKSQIEKFLRNVRIQLLQSENISSSELLRYLYSGIYLPNLKDVLNDDFNRIEGDIDRVRQYLLFLGKKIAIQERKKRIKAKKGKIHFRRTIRKNISVGGTLLNISYHKKKRKDPRIILLADVSGSTEWVSEFFFVITYAAQSTFKKLALFEFDNTAVEITKGLKSPTLSQALLKRIQSWETPPRAKSGHSNYQTAFEDFIKIGEKYFSKETNILILGDCRDWLGGYKLSQNGDYEPESKIYLEKIVKRVKRVIILNPESPTRWDTGDSVVSHFIEVGAKIYHVDNIMSIIEFIFKKNWYY
jgi:uncharacterized protein with von Willebrand factor type A (vWA) domain